MHLPRDPRVDPERECIKEVESTVAHPTQDHLSRLVSLLASSQHLAPAATSGLCQFLSSEAEETRLNALVVVDCLFKRCQPPVLRSLQAMILSEKAGIDTAMSDHRFHNFLSESGPTWIDLCSSLSCLLPAFAKWVTEVSEYRLVPKITSALNQKLLADILIALNVMRDFLNGAAGLELKVTDVAERASELEPVIVDGDLHQAIVTLFEIANVLTGRGKVDRDQIAEILRMTTQRVQELMGEGTSPTVPTSHVRGKEVQDPMPVEEFFRQFDRIKAEDRSQLIDFLE